jgi:hypothetical protein
MDPSDIICPWCGARAGHPCVSVQNVSIALYHEARVRSANTIEEDADYGLVNDGELQILELDMVTQIIETHRGSSDPELADHAAQQLQEIVESAELDDTTRELVLIARTPEGIEITERVQSLDELRRFLQEFGFSEDSEVQCNYELGFGYGGEIRVSDQCIDGILAQTDAADLFVNTYPDGQPLFKCAPSLLVPGVRVEIASVNQELLKFLAAHPESIYALDPRHFEELVAEIFRDFGYEVLLTPRTRDGGLDIRAIKKDSVGTLLYLIECKRYAATRPVGVEIVRGLYGVATEERASCGIIATTSHFTRDAKEFADKIKYQMSLRDYKDLVGWLKQYPTSAIRSR